MRTPVPRSNQAGTPARLKRVLEQAEVALRRAHEDRHLVEAHAAARLAQNAPRDLDALAALAGRGEELERAVERRARPAAPRG